MIRKNSTVRASCHCGSIQLDIFLLNGLEKIIRCNCSMCSRNKGFGMVSVSLDDCVVIQGRESMTEYIFNTASTPHVFCIVCGIHTHHKSRTIADRLFINIACLNDVNIADYTNEFINFNGMDHPKDA
jgi:hypothetical protein